jgi:hypothetical protein
LARLIDPHAKPSRITAPLVAPLPVFKPKPLEVDLKDETSLIDFSHESKPQIVAPSTTKKVNISLFFSLVRRKCL